MRSWERLELWKHTLGLKIPYFAYWWKPCESDGVCFDFWWSALAKLEFTHFIEAWLGMDTMQI